MSFRHFTARVAKFLAVGAAVGAGLPVVVANAHLKFTADYGSASGTWIEQYHSFLAGNNSLMLLTVLQPVTSLLAVAFVHAVWQRSLTVVTLFGASASVELGLTTTLPPFLTPLARRLCPVCAVSGLGVEVPVGVLVVAAAVLCNTAKLLDRRGDTGSNDDRHHGSNGPTDTLFPTTGRQLGCTLANLSGYILVTSILLISIFSSSLIEVFKNIDNLTAGGLAICALVLYEFVSTNAGFSLAALALVTWQAGLAALQYDTALSEFLLSTATLLTISAAGFLYSTLGRLSQRDSRLNADTTSRDQSE